MKPKEPFSCKHCDNPEKHDRRVCRMRAKAKVLHADPVWTAAMKERNSKWLKDKWAKIKQAERN